MKISHQSLTAPGEKPKAGTELTYQQLEDELTKNTTQIMDACKAAIAASEKTIEAKLETTIKAAVEAAVPKPRPNGKGMSDPAWVQAQGSQESMTLNA